MQIGSATKIRAAKGAAATDWNFAGISVNRMVSKFINGCTALQPQPCAQSQPFHSGVIKGIAEERIECAESVSIQRPDSKLVAQQVEVAGGEIKQRRNAWVSLSVVITESAFVVTSQESEPVIKAHEPSVSK